MAFRCFFLYVYLLYELQGKCLADDRGIVLGVWNNASLSTITKIPTSGTNQITTIPFPLNPINTKITSIAAVPRNKMLFVSAGREIFAINNYSIWQNESLTFSVIFSGKSYAFGQIAFDHLSNNLYWCDGFLNWIAMKSLNVNNTNTTYKVIIDKHLEQPEGLALDPEDGLLFFSENSPSVRIEKASLDGENRSVIVYRSLLRIMSLSTDTENNLLYWADLDRETVEVCNYDGSNRKVLRRMVDIPLTGVQYFEGVIHGVSLRRRKLVGIDVNSREILYEVTLQIGDPFVLAVYDVKTNTSLTDPCSGQYCQHICVNTPPGPKCLCAEGYILGADSYSCNERSWFYDKGIIVNNATMFYMLDTRSLNGQAERVPYFQIPTAIMTTFAINAYSREIYFADAKRNEIYKLDIYTNRYSNILSTNPVADLNYDWISNLLCWIEPNQSSIRAYYLKTGSVSTVYSNLQQPISLTVDAMNGAIFWISSTTSSIIRGSWDRNPPKTLISDLDDPMFLKYDITSQRIFWLESSVLVKSSQPSGSDIKSHIIASRATDLFIYKDFIGWLSGEEIHFSSKTSSASEVYFNIFPNPVQVKAFDPILQDDLKGTCQILNGRCGDICIPTENKSKCECDIGLQLQADQRSCDSNFLNSDFIIASDFTHGRILQINFHTGEIVKLPINVQPTSGITLDKTTKEIIYFNSESRTVQVFTLQGKMATLTTLTGFTNAESIAVDQSTGNIYFTAISSQPNSSYVGVLHRTQLVHKILIHDLQNPKAIVLHSAKGILFWTETGIFPRIVRASMDGTSKEYIVTIDGGSPNGLALDFETGRLYWTDGQRNTIEYTDLDGRNQRILATAKDAQLADIVLSGQFLYYTAWNRQRITRIDKTSGAEVPFMENHPELGRLDSIAIYTNEIIDVNTNCSIKNGLCSTFCLPVPGGRACACEDNVSLEPNNAVCTGVPSCKTTLVNTDLLECFPYPGQTCQFECKSGFKLMANTTLSCNSSGQWSPDTDRVCTEILCPSSIHHARLAHNCSRKVAETCDFSCEKNYDRTTPDYITCNSSGDWNKDTSSLCFSLTDVSKYRPDSGNQSFLYVYIGIGFGVLVALVVFIVACRVIHLRKSTKPTGLQYESSVMSERNHYSAFMNGEYQREFDRPSSGEYNTIAEMMEREDTKAEKPIGDDNDHYLSPCSDTAQGTYIQMTDPYVKPS